MRFVSLAVVFSMLAPAGAVGQIEPVEQLVAEAERHIQAQSQEDAARLLCDAWRQLRHVPGAKPRDKRDLERRLSTLLRKTDRAALSRMKLLDKSAGELEKLAKQYLHKGWLETAEVLFEQVEALDPGRVREDLVAVRDALAVGPNDYLFGHFDQAKRLFGDRTWAKRDGWIEGPRMDSDGAVLSQSIVGWESIDGHADISVEIQIPDGPGKAGLVFGCNEDHGTFYLLEIVQQAVHTSVYLRHYDGEQFHIKHTFGGKLLPEVRKGFVPLYLNVRGHNLEVTVSDMPSFQTRVDTRVEGKLGLFVSGDTLNSEPVRFRHLRVQHD